MTGVQTCALPISNHTNPKANVQAISARMWSAGFLSGQYAGVSLRSTGDPVLFLNNPDGVPAEVRRRMLDSLAENIERRHRAFQESLVETVQPAIITAVGLLVFGVCVGIFYPIIHLIQVTL